MTWIRTNRSDHCKGCHETIHYDPDIEAWLDEFDSAMCATGGGHQPERSAT